jgi:cytochrome c biogenesis protein CcdA
LVEAFHGNDEMAAAVNHLLRVGFYLVNLGFVLMFLRYGTHPDTVVTAVEYLTTKVGMVLMVLGAMHFFNMFNFDKMRKKGRRHATEA